MPTPPDVSMTAPNFSDAKSSEAPRLDTTMMERAVSEALETMAFAAVWPPDSPEDALTLEAAPPRALCVSLDVRGPWTGRVELVASLSLGQMLAANMLGVTSPDEVEPAHAADAMGELLNVTAGLLMRQIIDDRTGRVEMSLPISCAHQPSEWASLTTRQDVCVLESEAGLLALCAAEAVP